VVEIERILRRASRKNLVTPLLGADAHTAAVVREIETGDYDVVHFAGHAWFDERQAYLWLNDGAVWASEVASILNRRPPSLLVLNSHYTAYVPVGVGVDGRVGLGSRSPAEAVELAGQESRGFARIAGRAGVGAFLGCVASPTDETAAQLAIELYRRLADGIPVALALHEARVATCSMSDASALFYSLTGYPEITLPGLVGD
jgi:CHAT domain-containing protein